MGKNHECDCCNHDHDEQQFITLTLEDDREIKCEIIGIFEVEDQEYIALLPGDDDDVLLYRYKELDNGEVELDNIDSDDEYEEVSEVFFQLLDEEEFDDFDEDDDFEDFDDDDDDEDDDFDEGDEI